MARTQPDNNDVAVWLFNEPSGNMVNSSTSPSTLGSAANLTTVNGTLRRNTVGLFMPPDDGALWIPGNSNFPSGASSSLNSIKSVEGNATLSVPYPISVSGWAKVRYPLDSLQAIVNKFYRPDGSWTTPFLAWSIWVGVDGGAAATNGSWQVMVTISGTLNRMSMSATADKFRGFPRGVWSHVGFTYDGATLKAYLNGELANSMALVGAIDYGTNGAINFGCVPGLKQEVGATLQDWRLANVARPLSYFKEVYEKGVLRI